MSDRPNLKVKPMLEELVDNIEKYDISTFKAKMRVVMVLSDDRPEEDRTDFSFEQRRHGD